MDTEREKSIDDSDLNNYFQDAEIKFRKEETMIAKMELDDVKRKLQESTLEIESLKFLLTSREQVFSQMKLRLEQAEAEAKFVNAMNAKHLLKIQKTLTFLNDTEKHMQKGFDQRLPSLLDLMSPSTVGDDDESLFSDCSDVGFASDENSQYKKMTKKVNSNKINVQNINMNRNQTKYHVQVPPSPRALFNDLDEVLLKEGSSPQTSYEEDERNSLRETTSYAMKYLRRSPIVSSLVTPFKSDDSHCTSTTASISSFEL